MNGSGLIGETLETGIETAGSAVATLAEKGTEMAGAVATVPEKAAGIVTPAAKGMLETLESTGGRHAADPDQALKALATIPINLPSLASEAVPQAQTPAIPAPAPDEIPEVIDADGFRVISDEDAITPRLPSDVDQIKDGSLVPMHGDVVPVKESVDTSQGEPQTGKGDIPPEGENPFQPIFEQVQPLSETWTNIWGKESAQHLLNIFPSLNSERVTRKVNVIFPALSQANVPLERIITSILYALEPDEAEAYLAKVKAEIADEEEKANAQVGESEATDQTATPTETIEQTAQVPSQALNALESGSVPKALGQGTENLASQVQNIVGEAQQVATNTVPVAAPGKN